MRPQPFGLLVVHPERGLHRSGHVEVHHLTLRIIFAGHLVALLRLVVGNHPDHDVLQIPVAAGERGRLFAARLGKASGPRIIALTGLDGENVMLRVEAILHINVIKAAK